MNKKKILVVIGAMSNEHEVSIVSGRAIYSNLDEDKYIKDIVYLDKENKAFEIDIEDFLNEDNKYFGYLPKKKKEIDLIEKAKEADLVFIAIHGYYGEDGKLQKIFEENNIKFTGCKSKASENTFDKAVTKEILREYNINMAKDILLTKDKWEKEDKEEVLDNIQEKLGFPVYIKPSRSGSSVGVYRAGDKEEFLKYIDDAFKVDEKVLVEEEIIGLEIEIAVIEKENDIIESDLGIIIPDSVFYTYDSKYKSEKSETRILKNIEDFLKLPDAFKTKIFDEEFEKNKEEVLKEYEKNINEMKEVAVEVFRKLECKDLSRIDFFLTKNGYVFNEINTMPGFTNISMYPKLIAEKLGSFSNILDTIIENN